MRLSNPIIAASSNLTKTVKRMKNLEESSIGAIIVKSLLEKKIAKKAPKPRFKIISSGIHLLKSDSLYSYEPSDWSLEKYAGEITKAKKELRIPVIASLACITDEGWMSYGKDLEEAGADAIELNFSCPVGPHISSEDDFIDRLVKIVKMLKQELYIPIIAKLTPQLTNPTYVSKNLEKAGADAVVMFNRFSGLEINIKEEKPILCGSYCGYGGAWQINHSLRWVSASFKVLDVPISGSGGVSSAEDIIKYILAGATTVQLCTLIHMKGISVIKELNKGLRRFMIDKGYSCLDDFRGKVVDDIIQPSDIDVSSNNMRARIDPDKCNSCGICEKVCMNNAIVDFQVSSKCEGCGLCAEVCANKAISMVN